MFLPAPGFSLRIAFYILFRGLSLIFLAIQIFHIIHDHQCDLERQRVIKTAQVQAGALLDLLDAVHQRITMYEQLSGGL